MEPPSYAQSDNPSRATFTEATDRRAYVHVQMDRVDNLMTRLADIANEYENRLGQVLRQDMPNAVLGDVPKAGEAPPDVPLGSRLAAIAAQGEVTLVQLQSLLDRLEV